MADVGRIEITALPEITSNELADSSTLFLIKDAITGQDYKMRLSQFKSLVGGVLADSGETLVDDIVSDILPNIESNFEQNLETQISALLNESLLTGDIDARFKEIFGDNATDPRLEILELVDNVFANAVIDRKFDKEVAVVNQELGILNNEKLPFVTSELERVESELKTLNDETLVLVDERLAGVAQDLEDLNESILPQVEEALESINNRFPIVGVDITDETISAEKLEANTITALQIAALTITGDEIRGNSVHADKIIANTITASRIAAETITGNEILADSVHADRIISNTITADQIAANTITGDEVLVNSVHADRIMANTITADQIAANTITGNLIKANQIDAGLIAADAITTDAIRSGAIVADKIAAGEVKAAAIDAFAIDGMLITGTILRTTGSTSVPRVVIGDPSFPIWYGQGGVSTSNGIFFANNQGTLYAKNMVIEGQSVFRGSLDGVDGTFTGNLSGNTITGSTITGGTISGATIIGSSILTDTSGRRVEIEDDGTYLIWVGTGTKNDANALFYIKTDGTGFIKGGFLEGELVETTSATATADDLATATVTHNSKGNSIKISGDGSISGRIIGDRQGDVLGTVTLTIKIGSTTLRTLQAPINGLLYDSFNNETVFQGSTVGGALTTPSVGTHSISASITADFNSGASFNDAPTAYVAVDTFENVTG